MKSVAAVQEVPTPSAFVALQRSLAKQYSSVIATVSIEAFDVVNGEVSERPKSRVRQSSKWMPGYGFLYEQRELEGREGVAKSNETSCNRPDQCRTLIEADGHFRGIVQREPFASAQQPFDPVQMTLGKAYQSQLDSVVIEKAKTRLEGASQIVLEDTRADVVFTSTIDRRYGYMPTSTEIRSSAREILLDHTFEDYREVREELWLPFLCTRRFRKRNCPNIDYVLDVTTVSDLQVNSSIPDSEFRLRFPNGTYVHNKVWGIQYRTGMSMRRLFSVLKNMSLKPRSGCCSIRGRKRRE